MYLRVCMCVWLFVDNSYIEVLGNVCLSGAQKPCMNGARSHGFLAKFISKAIQLNDISSQFSFIITQTQTQTHTELDAGTVSHRCTFLSIIHFRCVSHTHSHRAHKNSNQIIINQEALEMWTPNQLKYNFGHFRIKLNWCVLGKRKKSLRTSLDKAFYGVHSDSFCGWLMPE